MSGSQESTAVANQIGKGASTNGGESPRGAEFQEDGCATLEGGVSTLSGSTRDIETSNSAPGSEAEGVSDQRQQQSPPEPEKVAPQSNIPKIGESNKNSGADNITSAQEVPPGKGTSSSSSKSAESRANEAVPLGVARENPTKQNGVSIAPKLGLLAVASDGSPGNQAVSPLLALGQQASMYQSVGRK